MKAVMISIQPKWCELIASGLKTIDVRETSPKIDVPFKCYICKTGKRTSRDVTRKGEEDWYGDILYFKTKIISYPDIDGVKVIGEFVCDKIYDITPIDSLPFGGALDYAFEFDFETTCLTVNELNNYLDGYYGYGWHISNLVIYDKPKELSEFKYQCKTHIKGLDECLAEDSCGCYENGDCRNGITKLIKPPQSWCYVEYKEAQDE